MHLTKYKARNEYINITTENDFGLLHFLTVHTNIYASPVKKHNAINIINPIHAHVPKKFSLIPYLRFIALFCYFRKY